LAKTELYYPAIYQTALDARKNERFDDKAKTGFDGRNGENVLKSRQC